VFGITLNAKLASPCPSLRSGTSHDASGTIVHVHSRAVSIVTVPDPPVAGNDVVAAMADAAHFALGAVVDIVDEPQAPVTIARHTETARRTMSLGATNLPRKGERRVWRNDRLSNRQLSRENADDETVVAGTITTISTSGCTVGSNSPGGLGIGGSCDACDVPY
jgi:hypothetical protein